MGAVNVRCGAVKVWCGQGAVRVRSRCGAERVRVRIGCGCGCGAGAGAERERQKSGCDVGAVIPLYVHIVRFYIFYILYIHIVRFFLKNLINFCWLILF